MCKPAIRAALPVIKLIQKGTSWEVHWDYQEAPESLILYKRREYLEATSKHPRCAGDSVCASLLR